MLPDVFTIQTVLRLVLLVMTVLLWRQIDELVNLSTAETPRYLRLVIVTQYVSLSTVMVWLIGLPPMA